MAQRISREPPTFDAQPDESATFAELPTELARDKSYPIFQRQLSDHFYRTASLDLWACEPLDQSSKPGEKQEEFRARLATQAGAARDAERAKVTNTYAPKLAAADAEVAKQQAKASSEKWQFFAKLGSVLMVIADMFLRAKGMGLPGRPRSASTAFGQAAKEHGDQAIVQAGLDKALDDKQRFEQARDQALADIDTKYKIDSLPLTQSQVKPRKGDIAVDHVLLLWLPYRVDATGKSEAVYPIAFVPEPRTLNLFPMTERERWIVYPLLFLALGAGLRDKLFDQTRTKSIECQELTVSAEERVGSPDHFAGEDRRDRTIPYRQDSGRADADQRAACRCRQHSHFGRLRRPSFRRQLRLSRHSVCADDLAGDAGHRAHGDASAKAGRRVAGAEGQVAGRPSIDLRGRWPHRDENDRMQWSDGTCRCNSFRSIER